MRTLLCVACLVLGGCLSYGVSYQRAFASFVGKTLTIQRPSVLLPSTMMTSVMFGGETKILWLQEAKDYERLLGSSTHSTAIPLAPGTELRVDRVERRNLIDSGTEVLAFGTIRNPRTGKLEPFVYELTRGLGQTIGRAPWEDSTVPESRPY